MTEKQQEARLAEIRRRNDSRKKFRNAGDALLVATTDDIDFLLDLLQQPASERCGECAKLRQRILELETEIDTKAGYL